MLKIVYFETLMYVRIIIEKNTKEDFKISETLILFYRSTGFPSDFVIDDPVISAYIGKLFFTKKMRVYYPLLKFGQCLFHNSTKIIRHEFRKSSPSKIGKLKIVTVKCVLFFFHNLAFLGRDKGIFRTSMPRQILK
jgi:hypothetical protein